MELLKEMSPSEIETEFRMLGPEMTFTTDGIVSLMKAFITMLKSGKYYELVQAYITLFLKVWKILYFNCLVKPTRCIFTQFPEPFLTVLMSFYELYCRNLFYKLFKKMEKLNQFILLNNNIRKMFFMFLASRRYHSKK